MSTKNAEKTIVIVRVHLVKISDARSMTESNHLSMPASRADMVPDAPGTAEARIAFSLDCTVGSTLPFGWAEQRSFRTSSSSSFLMALALVYVWARMGCVATESAS